MDFSSEPIFPEEQTEANDIEKKKTFFFALCTEEFEEKLRVSFFFFDEKREIVN